MSAQSRNKQHKRPTLIPHGGGEDSHSLVDLIIELHLAFLHNSGKKKNLA